MKKVVQTLREASFRFFSRARRQVAIWQVPLATALNLGTSLGSVISSLVLCGSEALFIEGSVRA